MRDLDELDLKKYGRQLTIPGFGEEAQRKLKNSSALITRAGGLGGPVALYLAAAGVGRRVIHHRGNTTRPNQKPMIMETLDHVGRPRAEKIRESILRLNPQVDLTVVAEDPNDENLDRWVPGVDILCDCTPMFEERYAMNRASIRHRKPMVEAAMNSMDAHLTVFVPGETPCLQCLYPEMPDWWSGTSFPVLGAVSGALGCLAAIEAIKVLTGFGPPLTNRLLAMDTLAQEHRKFKIHRDPACPACAGVAPGA